MNLKMNLTMNQKMSLGMNNNIIIFSEFFSAFQDQKKKKF